MQPLKYSLPLVLVIQDFMQNFLGYIPLFTLDVSSSEERESQLLPLDIAPSHRSGCFYHAVFPGLQRYQDLPPQKGVRKDIFPS